MWKRGRSALEEGGGTWIPRAVLALGLASIGLLIGTNYIRERLLTQDQALVRAGGEIQSRMATSHLWVEEYVTGDLVDLEVIVDLESKARQIVDAMLHGGTVDWANYSLEAVREPELRPRIERVSQRLDDFLAISARRLEGFQHGEDVGIGSALDVDFDEVFNKLFAEIEGLNSSFAARLDVAHERSRWLFRIILIAWIAIVALAVSGLWTRERLRLEAEAELRKSQEQLFQSQKLESMGRLAGGIAHDINNYLAAIMAQCEVIKLRPPAVERLNQKMDSVMQTSRRASELIHRLLAFGRRQMVQPEVVSLNRAVDDLTPMLKRLIGEDVELTTRLEDELWSTEIDPAQLEQVIVNLVVNAHEAMPNGGSVTLETSNFESASSGNATEVPEGRYALLRVTDTGIGIPLDIQKQIFEPFVTTKAAGTSSGLGLATVYGILEQNGGHTRLSSRPGEGATFSLFFAWASGEESFVPSVEEDAPALPDSGTVLLVEDNEELRATTVELLEGVGLTVVVAGNGLEGVEVFKKTDGIDFVITDVVMPEMNGRDMVNLLRELRPELPVLYVSGYAADVMARHGVSDERVNFLQKPFSAKQLWVKIQSLLAERVA